MLNKRPAMRRSKMCCDKELRMATIVYITQKDLNKRNGESAHVLGLASGYSDLGHEVLITSPYEFHSRGASVVRKTGVVLGLRLLTYLVYEISVTYFLGKMFYLRGKRSLVVHVRSGFLLVLPLIVARIWGVHTILEINAPDE